MCLVYFANNLTLTWLASVTYAWLRCQSVLIRFERLTECLFCPCLCFYSCIYIIIYNIPQYTCILNIYVINMYKIKRKNFWVEMAKAMMQIDLHSNGCGCNAFISDTAFHYIHLSYTTKRWTHSMIFMNYNYTIIIIIYYLRLWHWLAFEWRDWRRRINGNYGTADGICGIGVCVIGDREQQTEARVSQTFYSYDRLVCAINDCEWNQKVFIVSVTKSL